LARPSFLREIVDLYSREIDWIWELLQHSRLERLIREYDDFVHEAPQLWDQIKVFAMAILAVTAQLSPTDVEVIIMCDGDMTDNAKDIAQRAYEAVQSYIASLADSESSLSSWSLSKRQWSAEVFAASYLMRNYEKHTGAYRKQAENLVVDLARMQHAGYMQQPCRPCEMSKQWQLVEQAVDPHDWPTNHDFLAHNVFWAYYTLDRLSTVAAGSTYTLQSIHADVCLNDVFGHTHISHLDKVLSKDAENLFCSEGAADPDRPVQSSYSGAKCRFAAVASHFADRLTAMRSPKFDWHKDIEAIVHDLEADLLIFNQSVLPTLDNAADRFSRAKKLTLALCIELLRTSIVSQLYIVFAATLFRRSLGVVTIMPDARQRIGWELQRRKLDSAKALIMRVLSFGNAALLFRSSWPFFASCVFVQVKEIIGILDEHLGTVFGIVDLGKREQLLDGLQTAVKGRNFLVLLCRRDHLALTRSHVQQACQGLASTLRKGGVAESQSIILLDASTVVDDKAIAKTMSTALETQRMNNNPLETLAYSAVARHHAPYPTPPDDNDLVESTHSNLDALFFDLAELERLFAEPEPLTRLSH
jgi:hypothetical protein